MPDPLSDREKLERQNRMRRNFRLLALFVAIYFFISAGYGYYNHATLPKIDENLAASDTFIHPEVFRNAFNACLSASGSALPTANADDTHDGYVAVLAPGLELRGLADPDTLLSTRVQVQARYPDALPPEAVDAIRAFVGACENTTDEDHIRAIVHALGVDTDYGNNARGKEFKERKVQNDFGILYEISFTPGEPNELTVQATKISG